MSNRKQQLFQDEYEYLAGILTKLDEALAEAESNVERIDKEYMDEKRYMAQYRGEIDPHEMFQNELALRQIDRTGRFAVGVRDRLTRLMDSPYFARVDFREDGETEEMKCYVGRFSFSYHNELLICDWRSPVARLFYDCKIGKASYDSPCKAVEGELTGKRQFKIKSGKMEYVIETSDNIQDDILQKELSQTSDEKMKSIISTIQKEQNRIIRNETAETMIIQGVAGSGKTSIALHRIAFLLYRFKERLSSLNVAIISPNKVFSDYISNVLPELGEEPIYETSFDDIARIQLEKIILFEGGSDPLEFHGEKWKERVRFKSTYAFVQLMDQYIQELSLIHI